MCQHMACFVSLCTSKVSVSFSITIDLSNAPRPANANTAMIVGVLFRGVAIGVVAVLLVQGIVCGARVCKRRKWKKHPTSTETHPMAENKSVTHSISA